MNNKTRICSPAVIIGRRRKAEQFAEAFSTVLAFAAEPGDVADACATLAIHAGIAAADVVCCSNLGRHHQGDDHRGAVTLLSTVDATLARHLSTLLSLKTIAGYGHDLVTAPALKRAERSMNALMTAAMSSR